MGLEPTDCRGKMLFISHTPHRIDKKPAYFLEPLKFRYEIDPAEPLDLSFIICIGCAFLISVNAQDGFLEISDFPPSRFWEVFIETLPLGSF